MTQDYAIAIEPHLVHSFWQGRGDYMPVAIVEHMMQGTLEDTYRYFSGEMGEYYVSTHYGIARDGRIWQFVHEEDTAWSNGVLQKPDTSLDWMNELVEFNVNANIVTISIAYEGWSGEPLTEAQYEAALALHSQIVRRWDIPADDKHIVGQDKFDSLERAENPGKAFPWQRLLNDLNTRQVFNSQIFTAEPEPAPEPEPQAALEIDESVQPFDVAEEQAEPFDDVPTYVPPSVANSAAQNALSSNQPLDLNVHEEIEAIKPPPAAKTGHTGELSEEMGGNIITWATLGGGIVAVELANIRMRPSYEPRTILRTAAKGTRMHFDGYSEGPEVQGVTRWYHISRDDGGGWINSGLVRLDSPA